jgi:hypothetical protein
MMTVKATREEALQERCPQCNAAPGQVCSGSRGTPRQQIHVGRYRAADQQPGRELRSYDLGPIGDAGCPLCESLGFQPITEDGETRYAPCSCRSLTT